MYSILGYIKYQHEQQHDKHKRKSFTRTNITQTFSGQILQISMGVKNIFSFHFFFFIFLILAQNIEAGSNEYS